MRYSIKNIDNLQTMSSLLTQMKDSLVQQQELIIGLEKELDTILDQSRRSRNSILDSSSGKLITGIRQFADYIHRSPATAQKILNSRVLQDHGAAYRVANTWTFNLERLDQLIEEDPHLLRC